VLPPKVVKKRRAKGTSTTKTNRRRRSRNDNPTFLDVCFCCLTQAQRRKIAKTPLLLVPCVLLLFALAYYVTAWSSVVDTEFMESIPAVLPRPKNVWPSKITPRTYHPVVIRKHLHNILDFTQGFEFGPNGRLWQSTGLYGKSKLQRFDTYNATMKHGGKFVNLKPKLFGEGITIVGNKLYQLTWREGVILEYDISTEDSWITTPAKEIFMPRPIKEGWGLAHTGDNKWMLLSDGSDKIYWIDPDGFRIDKTIPVREYGMTSRRLSQINELEYDQQTGLLYANVWFNKNIYIIHPESGVVVGRIPCDHLFPHDIARNRDAVLNGIAITPERTLLITGKLWTQNIEIEIPDIELTVDNSIDTAKRRAFSRNK